MGTVDMVHDDDDESEYQYESDCGEDDGYGDVDDEYLLLVEHLVYGM